MNPPCLTVMPRAALRRLALSVVLILVPAAQAVLADTVADVVAKALAFHPQVARADALARAAGHDVDNARAGYLPSVDLNGGIGLQNSSIKQLNPNDNSTLTRREAGLSVRQLVFDGFLTQGEVARRRALLQAAEFGASDTRQSVAFDAVKAYLDVLVRRELLDLAQQNLSAHLVTRDRVADKVKSGVGQRADLQQAEGRVALARSTVVQRQGSLLEAETAYARLIGEAPGELAKPVRQATGMARDGEVQQASLQSAIDTSLAEAYEQHPALRQANFELEASAAAVKVAKAAYWPRVDVAGNLSRDANLAGVEGVRNTNSVMLQGQWNLFRGGADKAAQQASVERRFAAEDTVKDTRLAIQENVTIALKARATSEGRIKFLEDHVAASVATLDAYQAQFELSRRTLLDMLNAQNELFTAHSNLSAGLYEDLYNQFFVEAAKGTLTTVLGVGTAE